MKDLAGFARDNNVRVRYTTLDPGVRGLATKTADGYLILLSRSLSKAQAKVTTRHEVWHIALGHLDERSEISDEEKEREVQKRMIEESKALVPEKRELIAKALAEVALPSKIENSAYQFIPFRVAGVSFKSGNTPRQEYLHKIKYHEEPFDGNLEINLEQYDYQGEPALAVVVNKRIIGNVPRQLVQYLVENNSRILGTKSLHVYGGNDGKHYGCEVTLVLSVKEQKWDF